MNILVIMRAYISFLNQNRGITFGTWSNGASKHTLKHINNGDIYIRNRHNDSY
jgi:hypothetical protein